MNTVHNQKLGRVQLFRQENLLNSTGKISWQKRLPCLKTLLWHKLSPWLSQFSLKDGTNAQHMHLCFQVISSQDVSESQSWLHRCFLSIMDVLKLLQLIACCLASCAQLCTCPLLHMGSALALTVSLMGVTCHVCNLLQKMKCLELTVHAVMISWSQ